MNFGFEFCFELLKMSLVAGRAMYRYVHICTYVHVYMYVYVRILRTSNSLMCLRELKSASILVPPVFGMCGKKSWKGFSGLHSVATPFDMTHLYV